MSGTLHVITGLGIGGAETMLAQVAGALHERGLPQHVVSLRDHGPMAGLLEEKGVPVTAFNAISWTRAPACAIRLARLVNRMRPDVIQGWMYHGNVAAALAHRMAPGGARRRLYWNLRASRMDTERYGGIIGWNARLSAWPDLVISNSRAGMDYHVSCGFAPRRSMVIPNGIDTAKYRPDPEARREVRAELGIAEDAVVAIKTARVDAMKDHETFLAAMALNPDIQGLLAGRDTRKLTLPPNVTALGLRDDVARLCAASDIVVCSSAFGEGFSNALSEGMSAGLVPVATDVGDAAMIVADTGRIVAPRDPGALAREIAGEAARPPAELRKRGLRARERIVRNFTLERIVGMYREIYENDET